jgi:rhodanese-related sulfurtransferase
MKKIVIILSILSSIFGAKAQENGIEVLDVSTFKQKIKNKRVLLYDVRTSYEFKQGTIKNAINVDFFNRKSFLLAFEDIEKNTPIYLFCRSGNRSNKAARLLVKQGFIKVYDLKGGYIAWQNN